MSFFKSLTSAALNPLNAFKSVSDYLTDGSQTTQETKKTIPARDEDANTIWDQYMSSFGTIDDNIMGQSSYLDNAFSKYSNAIGSANNTYQGTLNGLINRLNSNDNKISFGMEGQSPISFTSRQDRENAEIISNLAQNILTSKSTLPTATYAEAQENNPYKAKLTLYNMLSDIANRMEDRRYNTATTSTTTSGESSLLDTLTSLANIGRSASQAYGASGGF